MILEGDCVEKMRELPESSVDAIVTDPPAGISFMGKPWDGDKGGRNAWVKWLTEVMRECLRVAKPGAHALVWALPRTSHWTGWAIEEAGWEIRDRIVHHFGSGFPKSLNLEGGLGTALKPGTEDWWLARKPLVGTVAANVLEHGTGALNIDGCRIGSAEDVPSVQATRASDYPQSYEGNGPGWGRSRGGKAGDEVDWAPSSGRWPANVALSHLPECVAVGTRKVKGHKGYPNGPGGSSSQLSQKGTPTNRTEAWSGHPDTEVPAYRCAEGCPVAMLDEQSGEIKTNRIEKPCPDPEIRGYRWGTLQGDRGARGYDDTGGASRFFYVAKSSRSERTAGVGANAHPT